MIKFGGCHLKKEGCAMHPDDTECDLTDVAYVRQLEAYWRETCGDVFCSVIREDLVQRLEIS